MRKWIRFAKTGLMVLGALALAIVALAFTRLPVKVWKWLGPPETVAEAAPDVIAILGGGGIPSESGLMRAYMGAVAALRFPGAAVIISLPTDGDPEESSVGAMRDELVMRGVAAERITLEHDARNTHFQAEAIADILTRRGQSDARVLVVSSGYHLRRATLCFRKAGLTNSVARPPTVVPDEYDLGPHVQLRYWFWNNLHIMVLSARELTALAYYRLRGWI